MVRVSYHAQEQMKRLSPGERREFDHLFEKSAALEETRPMEHPGRFVSRLGQDKRVVWQKTDDGDVLVLTVISK